MVYIYCLTFPNLKKYIGLTENIKRRMQMHQSLAKRENPKMLISRAFKKYKTCKVTILGYCQTYKEAEQLEIDLIKEYETQKFGYNVALGGNTTRGYRHTVETKLKISKAGLGRTQSKASRKKLSQSRKALNLKISNEAKIKMARSKGAKPFKAISKDGIVTLWELQTECQKALGLTPGKISECLYGKRKQHKGYTFEVLNG